MASHKAIASRSAQPPDIAQSLTKPSSSFAGGPAPCQRGRPEGSKAGVSSQPPARLWNVFLFRLLSRPLSRELLGCSLPLPGLLPRVPSQPSFKPCIPCQHRNQRPPASPCALCPPAAAGALRGQPRGEVAGPRPGPARPRSIGRRWIDSSSWVEAPFGAG